MSKRLTENRAINILNKVWKEELSKYGIDHYYWRRSRLEWRYTLAMYQNATAELRLVV